MKKLLLFLALLPISQWLSAQDMDFDSLTPLPLYINGEGKNFPFQEGQMLPIGQRFFELAIPDRGYRFNGWEQVEVFTFHFYIKNTSGQLSEITSYNIAPDDELI